MKPAPAQTKRWADYDDDDDGDLPIPVISKHGVKIKPQTLKDSKRVLLKDNDS